MNLFKLATLKQRKRREVIIRSGPINWKLSQKIMLSGLVLTISQKYPKLYRIIPRHTKMNSGAPEVCLLLIPNLRERTERKRLIKGRIA